MLTNIPATRFEGSPNVELRYPPIPRTVRIVTELLSSDAENFPDTARLAEIVAIDPIVSAAVLQRINTNYFGLRRRVFDVRKTVFMLGFLDVINVILTDGMLRLRSIVKTEEQVRVFEEISRHSIATAVLSGALAREAGLAQPHLAYSAGLLHGVGRYLLLYNKPSDYEALWMSFVGHTLPEAEDERAIFGVDHVGLNRLAADAWYLPADLATILECYDRPEEVGDPTLQALCVCVDAARALASPYCQTPEAALAEEPAEPLERAAAFFGLPSARLRDAMRRREAEVRAAVADVS